MLSLRYTCRQLLKSPGFTVVAVLTLALGIGANTVVFSVAKAVLLRSLGFEAAEQLVWIRLTNTETGNPDDRLSWRDYEDILESTRSFESVALFGQPGATLGDGERSEELPALRVTPGLGPLLHVRPLLGRTLLPADAEPAAAPVVLISYELWQSRWGGKADIIGQTLRVDEKTSTVVGVLPPGLQFPLERAPSVGTGSGLEAGVQAIWFPLQVQGQDRVARDSRMYLAVARLHAGATEHSARAELAALSAGLARDHPETNRRWRFDVLSFRDQVLGRTRRAMPALAAAVGAVLLICCINLANLLLARGLARQRELAVRLALGAGRGRLVQALLMESALLSLLGGALGVGLASGALQGIRVLASNNVPFIREATIDLPTLVFTVALSLVTALAFGWLPALRLSRVEAGDALRAGARTTGGPQIRAWQQALLIGQIAIVLALLSSAGLLLESFRRLMGQDLGYRPESVLALDLSLPRLPTNDDGVRFYREIHARLAALPSVDAVGTVQSTPLTGKWTFNEQTAVFDRPRPLAEQPALAATFVAFDYFQAMGIPLLAGRVFQTTELRGGEMPPVAVLNEAAAAELFPGASALGKRIAFNSSPDRYYEIIGVVRDTRDVRLEQKAEPRFYLNYAFGGAQFAVRSAAPPAAAMSMIREAIQTFDPRIVIRDMRPLSEIVSATVAERRFLMILLASYAAVALGIAAVGIFGVVACQVTQRTSEFGVRLALGSSPNAVLRLVLAQAGRLVLIGLAVGLALSFAAGQLLASQLFGLSPRDPLLLLTVSVLLLFVSLLASFLPARRAARVHPMEALRHE